MSAVPVLWRKLLTELNGRPLVGTPGVRDVDSPCEEFLPAGANGIDANGDGQCDTDGHYLCRECVSISLEALRGRRGECEVCGHPLCRTNVLGEHCPCCDVVQP